MTDTYKYFKYDSVLDFGHVSKAKQFFIIALTFLPPARDKRVGGGGGGMGGGGVGDLRKPNVANVKIWVPDLHFLWFS